MFKSLCAAALILLVVPAGAGARIWTVPVNAPTVQAAVDSCAASGDLIQITGGTYAETGIVVDGKNITIEPGAGVVSFQYASGNGVCITIRNATGGLLSSLNFAGFQTAVAVQNASPTIQFLKVKGCASGVTMDGPGGTPRLIYSLIDSCATGIAVTGGTATVQNETIVNCQTGVNQSGGTLSFTRSIVWHAVTGILGTSSATSSCNNYFYNAVNYVGSVTIVNDFYTDPMFCFSKAVNPYYLHQNSPDLNRSNPCGVFVGFFTGPGFGCTGTAVETTSWGAIKAIYR